MSNQRLGINQLLGVTLNRWPTNYFLCFSSFFYVSLSCAWWKKSTFLLLFECFWSFSTMCTQVQAWVYWSKYTTVLVSNRFTKGKWLKTFLTSNNKQRINWEIRTENKVSNKGQNNGKIKQGVHTKICVFLCCLLVISIDFFSLKCSFSYNGDWL